MKGILIELQGEGNFMIKVRDFNTLLVIDSSSRQKIRKHINNMKNITNEIDLIDNVRILYPKTTDSIFFLKVHGIFTKINYKTHLNKFK